MQGIYNYIPETKHVSILLRLQYKAHVMSFPMLNVLYLYNSTFCSKCALPSTAILCSCLVSCLPTLLLITYILNDCELSTVDPIITDVLLIYYYYYLIQV